jgi:orotate phosphoribosyltransferase
VTATSTASAWALAEYNEIAALFPDDAEDPEGLGPPPALIHGFLVRKAEKTHGTGRRLEGFLKPDAAVVIVDDVCTTGGSTITAIEATRAAGMKVAAVLCLVDRQQGGRANIEAALEADGTPFVAVFTASDVKASHLAWISQRG